MATISENLLTLNETKQAIKTAIENKGQDLTGVPFTNYATKISEIASGSGKKFTTGTVTFTTVNITPTITHNLGSIPSIFFMIAKNVQGEFTFNSENSPKAGIYGYYRPLLADATKYFVGENISTANTGQYNGFTLEWRNNNTTSLNWQMNVGQYVGEPTETTIKLSYRSANYKYLANQEYEWIAIE